MLDKEALKYRIFYKYTGAIMLVCNERVGWTKVKALLYVSIIVTISASLWANSLPDGFINNVDTALSMSSKSGKNILIVFCGSDWSARSRCLVDSCLSKGFFVESLSNNFELVYIDVLLEDAENIAMSKREKEINLDLVRKYGIVDYPALVLLNQDGAVIGKVIPAGKETPEGLAKAIRQELVVAPLVRRHLKPFSVEMDEMMKNWTTMLSTQASAEVAAKLDEAGQKKLFDKMREMTSNHLASLKALRKKLVAEHVPEDVAQKKAQLLAKIDWVITGIESSLNKTWQEVKKQRAADE